MYICAKTGPRGFLVNPGQVSSSKPMLQGRERPHQGRAEDMAQALVHLLVTCWGKGGCLLLTPLLS